MEIRVCFELSSRNESGNIDSTFGLAMTIDESEKEIDYQKLMSSINKDSVLRIACLDGIVMPEDMKVITPEEYDLKYGDGE